MHWLSVVCACIGGYAVLTYLLVRVWPPQRARRIAFPCHVVAHRGGCLNGPENTMWTFRRALREAKVDVLELDVALTADGEVVVTHDHDLMRQCGSPTHIATVESPNLPLLSPRIQLHFPSSMKSFYELSADPEDSASAMNRNECVFSKRCSMLSRKLQCTSI